MSIEKYRPTKIFTVEEANATLPLVRAIAADLNAVARSVAERRHRVAHLMEGRQLHSGDPYGDELVQTEAEIERDVTRVKEYAEELRQLGVEPKPGGLVDFPAVIDGRLVFLCWKLGESEVTYWHEIDAGYAGRQPLVAGSVAGGGADQDHGQDGETLT